MGPILPNLRVPLRESKHGWHKMEKGDVQECLALVHGVYNMDLITIICIF